MRAQHLHDLATEYKPGLLLLALVVIIGGALNAVIGSAPRSDREALAAVDRVYSLQAQPIVCLPARQPPTR